MPCIFLEGALSHEMFLLDFRCAYSYIMIQTIIIS